MTDDQLVTLLEDVLALRRQRNGAFYEAIDVFLCAVIGLPIQETLAWTYYLHSYHRIQYDPSLIPCYLTFKDFIQEAVLNEQRDYEEIVDPALQTFERIRKQRQLDAIARDFNLSDARQIEMVWKLTYGGAL